MSVNGDVLANCKLFDGLEEQDIQDIVEGLEKHEVQAGFPVIAEHTHGDNLYIILQGQVEINKELRDNDSNQVASLTVLAPGEFFGEMALVDEEPRSANAIALTDVEVLRIPKPLFNQIAVAYPRVMYNLIRTLSWRLRDTNQRFIDVMDKLIAQNRLTAIGMAASKIIHDIKTPLTVIVLTAQLIENLYPESKDFTGSIVRQTKTIDQMVREILDYAKGNISPVNMQKMDMAAFLNDVRDTIGSTIQGRKIILDVVNQVQQSVYFDDAKLRRVVSNLLKNSLEALKDDGVITIQAVVDNDELILTVSDTGPGLSERMRTNLFSPFQSEGKAGGTGLGLAICQKLIHEQKGSISYRQNIPSGAVFEIRIPQDEYK